MWETRPAKSSQMWALRCVQSGQHVPCCTVQMCPRHLAMPQSCAFAYASHSYSVCDFIGACEQVNAGTQPAGFPPAGGEPEGEAKEQNGGQPSGEVKSLQDLPAYPREFVVRRLVVFVGIVIGCASPIIPSMIPSLQPHCACNPPHVCKAWLFMQLGM